MNKLDDFQRHVAASSSIDELRLRRHEFIKSSLRVAGTSLAELGRELGLKNGTMSSVSRGHGQSKRVQIKIASALNMPVWQLFPERFTEPDKQL